MYLSQSKSRNPDKSCRFHVYVSGSLNIHSHIHSGYVYKINLCLITQPKVKLQAVVSARTVYVFTQNDDNEPF